jgi:hypothetical protein
MRVPWWGLACAVLAPVFLIGGWTVAAARQPAGFSPTRDTISALAGLGATDRWLMTAGFVGTGFCHLGTALALRPAALAGRLGLAVGGAATVALAAFPVPAVGSSTAHGLVAGAALTALALWPAVSWRRGAHRPVQSWPWALSPGPAVAATVGLLALLGWFTAQLTGDGALIGLTERFAVGGQVLWPLVVVLSAVASQARVADPSGPSPMAR